MDRSRINLFTRQGWQCPICGRVYSPYTNICLYCGKGISGVVNLGTVLTSHQDISGKADKSATVSTPKSEHSERKTGVWLIYRFGSDAQCSECKTFFSDVYDMENSDNYCRHCGAKMEGLKRMKDERYD